MKHFDYDQVAALTRAGLSANEIAVRLGCTQRTVVRIRKATGTSKPANSEYTGVRLDLRRLQAAREMLDEGAPHAEIMRTLGLSRKTLRKYFPGTAWDKYQVSELARAVRDTNQMFRRNAA